jgi:hypothetical protein
MIAHCSCCQEDYEEKDPANDIFIESGCPMVCYKCVEKYSRGVEAMDDMFQNGKQGKS